MINVETGLASATSETYASVAEVDAYAVSRGYTTWTGTDAVKESALRSAAQYIDTTYRFKGYRVAEQQGLMWPRSGVMFDGYTLAYDAIPAMLKTACMELAVKAISASLIVDNASQYVTDVSVGPIKKSMSAPMNGGQVTYKLIDSILRDLVVGGQTSVQLVRS
mgnify:CR=1 FL=1